MGRTQITSLVAFVTLSTFLISVLRYGNYGNEATLNDSSEMVPYVGKKKLIFLGSNFFGGPFNFGELPPQCETTSNLNDFWKADAVVFHILENPLIHDAYLNDSRNKLRVRPDQVWVVVMYESPIGNMLQFSPFNWTMTYRRDSDIYSPYCGEFKVAPPGQALADRAPELQISWHSRKHAVAWMVSNCRTANNRMDYAIELSKYIQVDIYGACTKKGLLCKGPDDVCWRMLATSYKFYLSFESSHCKDYITEKFYNPMYYGVLPIVYGGLSAADYSEIAPPHSYIDTRDFKSPKELAEYLHRLEQSPEEYNTYFEWRKHYSLRNDRAFVGQDVLCNKLWDLDNNRKSYSAKELDKWWQKDSNCANTIFKV